MKDQKGGSAQYQIFDYDTFLDSNNTIAVIISDLDTDWQEIPLKDILDFEYNAGNVEDYGEDFAGVGFVIVDPGDDYNYFRATNGLKVTKQKTHIYTFQDWASTFIDEKLLVRFLESE